MQSAIGAVLALTVALLAAPARAASPLCAGVYLAPSAVSDYRFDGFSQSNRHPTLQVVVHCYRTDGFYAGTVVTGVDFGETPPTRLETDLYVGKHIKLGAADLNLEGLWFVFPDKTAPGPSYNAFEPQAELSRAFGRLTLKSLVGWSPNYSGNTGTAWRVKESVSVQVTPWLALGGHLGRLWIARGQDRADWDVGATFSRRRLTLDVRYGGTNLRPEQCYYTRWCAQGAWAGVTWRVLP